MKLDPKTIRADLAEDCKLGPRRIAEKLAQASLVMPAETGDVEIASAVALDEERRGDFWQFIALGSLLLNLLLLIFAHVAHAQGGGTLGPQGRYFYSQGGDRAVRVTDGGTEARTAQSARYNLNVPCRHCADSLAANWKMTGSVILPLSYLRDTLAVFSDDADTTKKVKLQLSGLTTGLTRYLSVQDRSGQIALLSGPQTFVGPTTLTGTTTVNQQSDADALVVHYRSSIMATGFPLRIIDDDAITKETNIDATGFAKLNGLILNDAGSAFIGQIQTAVLTANRTYTLPNISNPTLQALSGIQTSTSTMTWSGAQTFSSATKPLFKTGITIEDPGAGTNTISLIAPTAPTTHTLTLPGANAAGVLTNNGSGTLSWAAAASGGYYGEATVTFPANGGGSATVTVADATITTASIITASIAYKSSAGRDADEAEMDPMILIAGNIVNGVSFDIIATPMDGNAHDTYLVHYTHN